MVLNSYLKYVFWGFLALFSLTAYSQNNVTTVYFHAWGGSPQINQYINWVGEEVERNHGIKLKHVKLSNTSDAVTLVLTQKASNKTAGTVDLIWLNGENFASMAEHKLLLESWAEDLPNFRLTNALDNGDITYDFGVSTLGRESPWGRASLVFYYNSEHFTVPPSDINALLAWAKTVPYRFTYPHVDDFIGISFVKYALLALNQNADYESDKELLFKPYDEEAFNRVTKQLWQYLDQLHSVMWRKGQFFVKDSGWLKRLFDDEEILLSYTFSAGEIPSAVDRFELPKATRSYFMEDGSLSNVHFVTIPFNAPNAEGAKIVANFLLSPVAQAKKSQPSVWGDATVLDSTVLNTQQRALFLSDDIHPSAASNSANTRKLKELHPTWIVPLKQAWKARYDN
ncbi:ABC transporter substrate-binding protein [Alteromonas sp. 5E99-2]|uniref:ABC transporter substrate-binding protein n=1 Tax=Alteromonas sp. 5E99-2 TaxID=2817683 RepID=UPI001A982F49|nr:ABC transporter substrate-binding protein [Alteromonas sp. 5E99-2]MBO1254905.1 ABC transporter substrate-binding protein [Alteromonas sp. 5E99-2]